MAKEFQEEQKLIDSLKIEWNYKWNLTTIPNDSFLTILCERLSVLGKSFHGKRLFSVLIISRTFTFVNLELKGGSFPKILIVCYPISEWKPRILLNSTNFLKRRTSVKFLEELSVVKKCNGSKLTFACSKSRIQTIGKGVKYVQS